MASGNGNKDRVLGLFHVDEKGSPVEDKDNDFEESDKESYICEGYYGSDRSDILEESECSLTSDVDFESYVSSRARPSRPVQESDLNYDDINLWSKIDPSSDSFMTKTCNESSFDNTYSRPKLKNCPTRNSPPDLYFNLFFTTEVWDLLTNETNKFANTPNRSKSWVDVTVDEMKKYVALLLNMGLRKTQDFTYFWKNNSVLDIPFYAKTMSLERFKSISSNIHMSSEQDLTESNIQLDSNCKSWARFRPLLNALNSSFMNFYVPAQDVVVHESVYGIVPKYKSVFVSYTPKHHVEFGLKKYDLCDKSTDYVLQSTVLSRADFVDNHINPFMQEVVFNLVSEANLLSKCYHLFLMNAYPKLPLVKSLLEHKVYVTANVNKKINELPKEIVKTKLNAGDTVLFKSDELKTLIVGFKYQKKSRYLVTSLIDDAEKVKERTIRKTNADNCAEFNPYIDAVDDFYKEIYDFTCMRLTSKYWRKIFYNLIDVTVLNSYILYTLNTDKPISKLRFISTIILSLVRLPLTDSESVDDESDDFIESEFSDLSDFLMSESDSTSDTKSEED